MVDRPADLPSLFVEKSEEVSLDKFDIAHDCSPVYMSRERNLRRL